MFIFHTPFIFISATADLTTPQPGAAAALVLGANTAFLRFSNPNCVFLFTQLPILRYYPRILITVLYFSSSNNSLILADFRTFLRSFQELNIVYFFLQRLAFKIKM
jgi:hypothetical protein